jgi:hypothetical protein
VEFQVKSWIFDEYSYEPVVGKYDIYQVLIENTSNNRDIFEFKCSDKELFQRVFQREHQSSRPKYYDSLQVSLYLVMEKHKYSFADMPVITGRLVDIDVGNKPQQTNVEPFEGELRARKLFSDVRELRNVGLKEFERRRKAA